jgi:endogenous inhibitor of DNA gyrase (YacG/DUF329 family)
MVEEKTDQETTLNCASCGKPVKKIKRYYRDGKFYCNKRCFKNKFKKPPEGE